MKKEDCFYITYMITSENASEAEDKAQKLAIEQTVEMPLEAVPNRVKSSHLAKVFSLDSSVDNKYRCIIECPRRSAGTEISQFINIIFGNISLKPGILLTDIDWRGLSDLLPGPAFGVEGIRKQLGIHERALSCTALKPLGLTSAELADLCYEFALNGLDVIKDDHGLANQSSSPFEERVTECCKAIDRAAQKTGKRAAYYPNITGDAEEVLKRYEFAVKSGASGVLLCSHIAGLPLMSKLARTGEVPVMAHPSFTGSYVIHPDSGMDKGFYYGSLWRALGADSVIFTNAQGRFQFTEEDVKSIKNRALDGRVPFKKAFPTPGGGIDRDTVRKWLDFYGNDTLFLIGGSLYVHPDGIGQASKEFQQKLENHG